MITRIQALWHRPPPHRTHQYAWYVDSPLVSVVLPVHNRSDVVAEALSSVLRQTYAALEVIVVDDGCTDTSMDEVHRVADARVRVVHNDGPHSASGARNCGIEHATGRYLAFQDSDDRWHPEKLAVQVHTLTTPGNEDIVLVGSGWRLMREAERDPMVSVSTAFTRYTRNDLLGGVVTGAIGTPMLLIDRDRVAAAPFFDTEFPSLEERDFVYRLLPDGPGTVAVANSILVDVRRGRSDHVANPAGSLAGYERFLTKYPTELAVLPGAADWYHYRAMREALILRKIGRAREHYRAIERHELRLTLEYRLGQLLGYRGLAIVTRLRLTPRLARRHAE
jgi:glycosyltransferase involved in cell wall biosynthesis